MIERSIGELCEEGYITFGRELNSNRALPLLYDGLKPSYRRMIWKAISAGDHIKSMDLIGRVQAIHPHSDKSIIEVESKLVRYGLLKELGNFGYYPIYGDNMSPAAPRYTSTGISDKWKELIAPFIELAPKMEGEVEGVMEPQFIPSAVPLALVFGATGIGIGINTNIPAFSAKSLLEAYLADDPSLLKPGYDLEFEEDLCELDRLWETGKGKVVYKYHVEMGWSGGNDGVYVSGDTHLFKPDWSTIDEWRNQGLVFIRDESTEGKNVIFIGRNKGVRKVTQEMIYEECLRCCSSDHALDPIRTQYRIGIHDGKIARYISIKEWVDITYKNYLSIIEDYKKTNIESIKFDIKVYSHLKEVAELLINATHDITNQEIADTLSLELDIVNAITRKSISTLKRVDTNSIIKSLKAKILEFDNINAEEFVKEVVLKM